MIFYYKPYRNIREQEIWGICYDDEDLNDTIDKEITNNPFMFENEIIAVYANSG